MRILNIMKKLKDTKTLVTAALLTAFTCIATMVIQIPTPSLGYIHPGDTLVILCGIILGPVLGSLSAGLGSMLADILSGYLIYAIPTLIIKGLTAFIACIVFQNLRKKLVKNDYAAFIIAGFIGEANVVFGYFITSIVKAMVMAGNFNRETLFVGFTDALISIPPNIMQGIVGIVLAFALFPLLMKVPDIRNWINADRQIQKTAPIED